MLKNKIQHTNPETLLETPIQPEIDSFDTKNAIVSQSHLQVIDTISEP
jgi:hypothetical protein